MRLISVLPLSIATLMACQGLACHAPGSTASSGREPTSAVAQRADAPATPLLATNASAASTLATAGAVTSPDFATIAEHVLSSVVSIKVEQRAAQTRDDLSERGLPPGFRFFGAPRGLPGQELPNREGLGSGFLIHESGLILTNYHVVDGADRIEVTAGTPDGPHETLSAKVIGKAPDFDVALLKTERPLNAPALALADSDQVKVGQWVMAVGNPFGLSQSMSVGIVSAKHREDINPSGQRGVYDFLQTDASINPGNSGGPLVDMNGRVVGMNTAISREGAGIGFAIPSNMLSRILPSLRDHGELNRSWIGVQIQPLTPDLAQSYGLSAARGALVADVVAGSPASDAGLQPGDILTSFDGKPIETSSSLPLLASLTENGKVVNVGVWRAGQAKVVSVKLASYPNKEMTRAGKNGEGESLGLSFQSLTPGLAEQLGVPAREGVVITAVEPGGVAARAGLNPGDVVTQIEGKPVRAAADLGSSLGGLESGKVLRLLVTTSNGPRFVALRAP